MLSRFAALSVFVSAASALFQIQSLNPACMLAAAGTRGCIAAASDVPGTPLTIHNCATDDLSHQDWWFTALNTTDRTQGLNIYGNMCMEVAGGVNAVGTPLQIAPCAPTSARQQFVRATPSSGSSAFALQWGGTDKCIDLTGGSIADDTPLLLATCVDGDTNQEFTDGIGTITIQPTGPVNEPFCMGATSATPGAPVMLLSCPASGFADPSALLTWTVPSPFTRVSTEPMAIATSFDLCLTVAGGVDAADGTTLELATCLPSAAGQQFDAAGGSSAQIQWADTGKCLTVPAYANETVIQISECDTSGQNQKQNWIFQ
ncbi:ricin B lectin domain-containing protein [Mycena pura]|uniref:Ricin B lectin domain-containing protein n=1 Tax=Mycena pura TaxID=153505 RepID=A0AAD6V2M4_9AGAR|nr:ricin B lectin domain-containing protein [Mycena pura]